MKPEPFAPWQCPLCGEPLTGDTALKCGRNHSFDRAKEGYWHLLPVQSMRTKAPGDSKEMVAARRAFLNAGYYGIFGRALVELCLAYGAAAGADAPLHLLDAGCGEGWYDRCIAQAFAQAGRPVQLAGFDIAKPAVRLAAKALPAAKYAVASSFAQPVRTGWAGAFFAAKMVRMRPGRRPAARALLLYSITHPIVKCVGFVGLHGEPDKSAFGNIFHFSTRRHEKDRTLPALPEASYENQSKFAIQNLFQCF